MNRFLNFLPAALALLASGCLGLMAGSTSTGNTGKGTIAGRVVDADGKGVAGARVKVVNADHNPGPGGTGDVSAIAVTESNGSFRTDSLPDGYYNLLDAKGQQVAFLDSIGVRSDNGASAPDAVLGPPGSVKGVVRLRPGDDSRTVFLVLIGTTTFDVPKDSIGNFSLAGLAEGEYRLRLLSTLDAYAPLDTMIRVAGGRETALPDTLRLAYRGTVGLPVIDNPALAYDSAALALRISWPNQDPARVAGYYVYRRTADSGFARLNAAPVKDTFFVDGWDRGFRPSRAYDYAVTALDSRGNEGLKGAASPFMAPLPYSIDTLIELTNCIRKPCPSDIDPDGSAWVLNSDTSVQHVTASGKASEWRLSLGEVDWASGLRVDDSGGIYILTQRMRVLKYDTLGRLQWEVPLQGLMGCAENCLYLDGDTVLVWSQMDRLLVHVSRDGTLLGQDTLPSSLPGFSISATFAPGIGFLMTDGNHLIVLDRHGNEVSRWSPGNHGFIGDLAFDSQGRWYINWSDGRMEVYSASHRLLKTFEAPRFLRRLIARDGIVYAWIDWALVRMRLGL